MDPFGGSRTSQLLVQLAVQVVHPVHSKTSKESTTWLTERAAVLCKLAVLPCEARGKIPYGEALGKIP